MRLPGLKETEATAYPPAVQWLATTRTALEKTVADGRLSHPKLDLLLQWLR